MCPPCDLARPRATTLAQQATLFGRPSALYRERRGGGEEVREEVQEEEKEVQEEEEEGEE